MNDRPGIYKKITSILISFQQFLAILMLLMLLTLVFVQVVLRSLNLPLMGIEELIIFPTIWLYMLGSANASEERSQINVDILEVFLSNEAVLTVIDLVKNLVSLFIGIFLTYWMFDFLTYSLSLWKYSPLLSMPMFFIESALFVGVFLMTLYILFDVINSIKNTMSFFKNKGGA